MNVIEMFEQVDGKLNLIGYRCSNCKSAYVDKDKAEHCCVPVTCTVCGKEISTDKTKCREYYYTNPIMCYDCHRKQFEDSWETLTEEEYWNRVHKENSDYGPVVMGDRWYTDLAEAVEELSTEDTDYTIDSLKSMRFQVGQILKPVQLHLDRLLEWETENWNLEDPDINTIWTDLPELKKFVKEWNKKQTYRLWETRNLWVTLSENTIKDNFYWLFEEKDEATNK